MLTTHEKDGDADGKVVAVEPLLSGFSQIDFYRHECALVAVSGGSDSMALLHLAKMHCEKKFPDTRLIAVTVDHGLRAEAAREAETVASHSEALGITHQTLVWDGDKPATGIQNAARQARQRLISKLAAERGASLVLFGHTANDLAETVAMRHRRQGTGNRTHGLAGIAPATLIDRKCWLVRPLLGTGRQTLRRFLTSRGIGWIDDPSNEDERYERVTMRASLDAFARSRWLQCAAQASAARAALAADAADLLRRGTVFILDDWPQRFAISRSGVMQAPTLVADCALRMVLQRFAGDDFPASSEVLAEITAFAINARNGEKRTAAKCVFTARRETIMVVHDPRARFGEAEGLHRVSSFDWPLANAFERVAHRRDLPRPPFV